ncbi:hypothetical protein KR067_004387, partial [Drosophila pandora]
SDSNELEDECGTIFYPIVKPLLTYFKVCQEKHERSSHWQDKYTEVLEKYSALQNKYSNLHDKLEENWSEKFSELQTSNQKKDLEIENLKAQINQLNNEIIILQKSSDLQSLTTQVSKDIEKVGEIIKNRDIFKNSRIQIEDSRPDPDNLKTKTISLPDRCPKSTQSSELPSRVFQEIQIPGSDPFNVICYSGEDEEPGWMLIAHKYGFTQGFNRTYEEFKNGFSPNIEYSFIGLERLHVLTNRRPHQMMLID